MALEELIVAWSRERPGWQREIMLRVAAGDALTGDDYDRLVEQILEGKDSVEARFGLEHLPHAIPESVPVRLVSVGKTDHVNALESPEPLTFEINGLTIVYGDNGSGKSGYARLLKRITRARHREEVLTDVFRDTSLAKPTAILSVRIGDTEESLSWPDSPRPELQRMMFYDVACGGAYISSESDFPYRPSALFVMDGLIDACVAVRSRIDARLLEDSAPANDLPVITELARSTEAGKFLASLSGSSHADELNTLIATFDKSSETIDDLKRQEARLSGADTTRERNLLARQAEKLEAVRRHLDSLDSTLGDSRLTELRAQRDVLKTFEDAAAVLAASFGSEPVPGVGSSAWKTLWEAARHFSADHAYPGTDFPFVGAECRCVFCQQSLDQQSKDRLIRFEGFVKTDIEVQLHQAQDLYEKRSNSITDLAVTTEAIADTLTDLEEPHKDVVAQVRALLTGYETLRRQTSDALDGMGDVPQFSLVSEPTISVLDEARRATLAKAEDLANPDGLQKQLAAMTTRRVDLELLQNVKKTRSPILAEIARLSRRDKLEAAKTAAATTGITKKVLDLSEESITEVVRDAFTRESDKLRLDRVTIARTRADKGALLHQPKLVGARQQVTLPRVFSEGERTALGLAAFFTEVQLDTSRSAIILDDPVTSLDHIRRSLVAARLATLAENRQVIVFTHDVAFVADLKREAKGKSVSIAERSVVRSRAHERKPGACTNTHPWKAKDVPARLDELRTELSRIRKESAAWDEKTYEDSVAVWAGNLSETWERIFSQEIVGQVLTEGGLEIRPMMVRILARFTDTDRVEFEASYSRVSQWAKRHDKSKLVNYVAPDIADLVAEIQLVDCWFGRVKGYRQ